MRLSHIALSAAAALPQTIIDELDDDYFNPEVEKDNVRDRQRVRLAHAVSVFCHTVDAPLDLPNEYGVFYARVRGRSRVTGINQKHFPTITGNGLHTVGQLARAHYRYTAHWDLFLRDLDESRVPARDEQVRLSFVGSHTMGCKFTNDTALATPELEAAVFKLCDAQPGYNFGRLDVRTRDEAALRAGRSGDDDVAGRIAGGVGGRRRVRSLGVSGRGSDGAKRGERRAGGENRFDHGERPPVAWLGAPLVAHYDVFNYCCENK